MIIKHIRLANYNRLVDRFLTSQVKQSSDIKKSGMGKIYAIVEITNPWHPNAQIGQTIINTLTRTYYRSANASELINFENALKNTNEALARIVQNGETDWIGKLNSVLAIICAQKLHLAWTGKAKAFLVRAGKIMPVVSDEATYPQEHPLKTFTNVVSGKLEAGDKMILTSPLLFDYLKPRQLEIILTRQNLSEATLEIAQILKSRKANHIGAILIEVLDDNLKNLIYPEVVYLDQQGFDVIRVRTKKILANLKLAFDILSKHTKKISQKAHEQYRAKILPQTQKAWQKTKETTKTGFSQIQNKRGPLFRTKTDQVPKITDKKIIAKTRNLPNVNHYLSAGKTISTYLKKVLDFLRPFARKIKLLIFKVFLPKNRSKLYIGIAVVLVIILIANVSLLRSVNRQKEQTINYEQALKDLSNKNDDAKLAILSKQPQKALTDLQEIQKALAPILANADKTIANRAQTLANDVQTEIDKISKTVRLNNPTEIGSLDSANGFYVIGNILAFNPNTNDIYILTIDKGQTAKSVTKIPTSAGLAKTATVQDTNLFIYTEQKNVYKYSNANLSKVDPISGSWSNAAAISSYLTNLYFLDGDAGQIYKYVPENESFSVPKEYIDSSKIDLKKSIDLAIDGSIYVLKKDGSIVKITLGKLEDFNIAGIPEPNSKITKPKQIFTNEDTSSIYVLDDNRILELDKAGAFISQYVFPTNFTNIKYFNIDPKSKELLILNDNTIYEFGL